MKTKLYLYSLLVFLLTYSCKTQPKEELSRFQCFNSDWKFNLSDLQEASDVKFDDSQWRTLDLPHDWSIELPFCKETGQIATGQTAGGTGWYRKKFSLQPEQENKIIQLYFEGSYMETEVWLNGQKIDYHPYGYTSFFCDITSVCNPVGKENTLAVKVSNEGKNSRWYAGSGLYRHVKMVTTDRLHIDNWGIFVTTPLITEEKAIVNVSADIINETNMSQEIVAVITIKNNNEEVASVNVVPTVEMKEGEKLTINEDIEVINPLLWSIDSPVLYTATVLVKTGTGYMDEMSVSFGIRSISFDSENGFLLNGKTLKLKGGCIHHDNGLLGAAAIDRAEEKKVELLKANGFNAVRCAHNPPSEKFLEACDRLGLLVINEAFDQWKLPKNPDDYHRFFDEWHEKDVTSMVKRDRNNPSIIMWSIGNEIKERADRSGVAIAKKLKSIIHRYDTTRPVTAAVNEFWDNRNLTWKDSEHAFSTLDVSGYNYRWQEYENDMEFFPDRVIYGAESYPFERAINWDFVEKYPAIIGDFAWTAIDYLGESGLGHALEIKDGEEAPSPWSTCGWPWFNGWCGDIDICGNKKSHALLRDVVWNDSKITMAVHKPLPEGYFESVSMWGWPQEFSEWNWKGHEDKPLDVRVFTRYPHVRLYLNGNLLDEKAISNEGKTKYIAQFSVNYTPGELKAVGLESREEKESVIISTTGMPARIKLTPDRSKIKNSRNDLSYISIELVDKNGKTVPDADCKISLSILGQGEITASGNASPTDMESFRSLNPYTFHGKALAIVRPTGKSGTVVLKATAEGLPESNIKILVN